MKNMDKKINQRRLTQVKRKNQTCKVYQVKIDYSHLSNSVKEHLSNLFREAKYFYNYCLSHKNINDADTTSKIIPVKIKDKYENRNLDVLSGQMKQGIKTRLFNNLSALKVLKGKGYRVGKLKFKNVINSIPLKQFNKTFSLKKDKIRIQGLKSWLKVRGLDQVPKDVEFANANLIRKDKDYYLKITTFINKQEISVPNTSIGIDFGCETQLTFSNNIKVKFEIPISKKLKRFDRKISKKNRKDSKNKEKDKLKRRKEYEKITNKKKDIRNKIVNTIINNYKYVCFQDESIHAWQSSNHGKKIQNTGIGGIIEDLKHKSHTPILINKFFPSTQLCPNCNNKQKLQLSERIYKCNSCDYTNDRDIKAAICIELEGMNQVPMDRRDIKLEEISTTDFFDTLSKIDGIEVIKLKSMSQEAMNLVDHFNLLS